MKVSVHKRINYPNKVNERQGIFSTLRCPYCGKKYHYEADSDNIFYYCENYECQKKMLGKDYPTLSLQDIACLFNYSN